MGRYAEQVLPRLVNPVMDNPTVPEVRVRVCARATGRVLELGAGSGLNLGHLPSSLTSLHQVEPSSVARRLAEPRIRRSAVPVRHAGLDRQRLDVPDRSFDTVLCTFTLCTIPDAAAALRGPPGARAGQTVPLRRARARALCRCGGVAAASGTDAATPRRGCHLTRRVDELVAAFGLVVEDMSRAYAPGQPRPFAYLYEGCARRSG